MQIAAYLSAIQTRPGVGILESIRRSDSKLSVVIPQCQFECGDKIKHDVLQIKGNQSFTNKQVNCQPDAPAFETRDGLETHHLDIATVDHTFSKPNVGIQLTVFPHRGCPVGCRWIFRIRGKQDLEEIFPRLVDVEVMANEVSKSV